MSLSIANCAAQFELYASLFDKDTAASEARYQAYEDKDDAEARAIRIYETYQLGRSTTAAHQLRFCAQFLRQQTPKWTKEVPTQPGIYWYRWSGTPDPIFIRLRMDDQLRGQVVGDQHDTWDALSVFPADAEWAGPIDQP